MRTPILFTTFAVLALLLAACSAAGTSEAAPAAGGLVITTEANPTPARVGDVEIILTVKDAQGNLVTGANVYVYADHTDMSGMTMNGQATDLGTGIYVIRANFSMNGNWKLKVEVNKDGQAVVQEISLVIK